MDPDEASVEPEGRSPSLAMEGFSGSLEWLLTLARAQKVDLGGISLAAIVDQLAAALQRAPVATPLGQKGDWVVMGAWLVQLRSRLLLPADAPAQQEAAVKANQFRRRLAALQEVQTLAGWLERRPQLGQEVFARGHLPSRLSLACSVAQSPEVSGVSVEPTQPVDVVAFLWASLALFNDGAAAPDTTTVYRPRPFELYTVADARERIRRQLGATPGGLSLDQFLPDPPAIAGREGHAKLRQRSAWSSTLIAGLELAKQGTVVLGQRGDFQPIHVGPP